MSTDPKLAAWHARARADAAEALVRYLRGLLGQAMAAAAKAKQLARNAERAAT